MSETVYYELEPIPDTDSWFVPCPLCSHEMTVDGDQQDAIDALLVHMNANHTRRGHA